MRVAMPLEVSEIKNPRTLPARSRGESVAVAILAALLYALSGARGMQWGDPAKLTLAVHDMMLNLSQEAHSGLVVWSWPFSLLPIEPYTLRLHISSAVTMGLALGVGHATLLGLGLARSAARIAMAAVAVAHTVWFTATMFESYPLVLLIVASASWLLVIPGKPLAAGLLLGAGISVHPLVGFGLLGFLYGAWRSRSTKGAAFLALGTIGGALVAAALIVIATPSGLHGINWGEATSSYAGLRYPIRNIPLLIGYAVYNFASPALILLALGWWWLPRPWKVTSLLLALPHYAVAAFWLPQRSYLIPLPVYFMMAYAIAVAAERLLRKRPALAQLTLGLVIALPPCAYALAPGLFTRAGLDRTIRDAPYRQEAAYFLRPWKFGERSAENYLQDLGNVLTPGSVAVGDWVLHTTLFAAQSVSGWREDVTLINADESQCAIIAEHVARRTRIYVLDDEPGYLPECLLAQGMLVPVEAVESLAELVSPSRE
jgi:hypothetical protein